MARLHPLNVHSIATLGKMEAVLPRSTEELLHMTFEQLEARFGRRVISSVCTYLSISETGLCDLELLDTLSLDDELLNELQAAEAGTGAGAEFVAELVAEAGAGDEAETEGSSARALPALPSAALVHAEERDGRRAAAQRALERHQGVHLDQRRGRQLRLDALPARARPHLLLPASGRTLQVLCSALL